MRVVAGKFKGCNLFSISSSKVRPTADATKERIFSIIGSCQGKKALDLFAGFGGLGLEAISREAAFVQFVDTSSASLAVVKKNIAKLQVSSLCQITKMKAESFLKSCSKRFDIIFLDPPYNFNLVNPTINLISKKKLLTPKGIIVIEHSPKEAITSEDFTIFKIRKTGNTMLTFLERKAGEVKKEEK